MERINQIIDKLYKMIKDMKDLERGPYIDKIVQRKNGKKLLSLIEDKAIAVSDFEFLRELSEVEGADNEKINKAVLAEADKAIAMNDFEFLCELSDFKGLNKEKINKVVLATKDAEIIYEYCRFKNDLDLQPFEDAIIETGDISYISCFAAFIKRGKDIEKLLQAICDAGKYEEIMELAENLQPSNRQTSADAFLNSENTYLLEMPLKCRESINLLDAAYGIPEFVEFAKFNGVDLSKFVDCALKLMNKNIYAFEYWTEDHEWPVHTYFYATDEQKFIEQKTKGCEHHAKLNEKQKSLLLTEIYRDLAQINNISEEDFSKLFNALIELGRLDDELVDMLEKATKENIKNFQSAIIEKGEAGLLIRYAAEVKGVDIKLIAKTLAALQSGPYIYAFAHLIKYEVANLYFEGYIEKVVAREDFIISKKTKQEALNILTEGILTCASPEYIQKYAKDIVDGDITRFEDEIIKRGDAKAILNMAKIKGTNVKRLQQALIQLDAPKEMVEFAQIKGANIIELEDRIIEIGEAKYMFDFAKEIKKANVKRLKEAISQTNDCYKNSYIEELDKLLMQDIINEIIDDLDNIEIED